MNMASSTVTAGILRALVSKEQNLESHTSLSKVLRLAAQWRATLLANTYVRNHGVNIFSGPFAGMEYLDYATEGCLIPRLLGCYESELHDDLRYFAESGIDTIVDIGCAEGYYAVGLARLMPSATVHAFDIDEHARSACADLARKNGVEDRVIIRGEFVGQMFDDFVEKKTLVIIDAEGFEDVLMQPDLYPALKHLNIIMETHPHLKPNVVQHMLQRFGPSHEIVVRNQGPKTMPLPGWLQELGHLDQLIAVWEFRRAPTPWLILKPRST
jgi:SAM-dependent methyltransferase